MSKITPARSQSTKVYRRRLGDYEITALSDGFVDLSYNVWRNIEREAFDEALDNRRLFKGGFRNGITSHLINTGERIILVDAGAAKLFGPNAYYFPDNLAQAGLTPADIDDVLITHAHPDHIGALISDGRAVLPNARLHINQTELDFWTSPEQQGKAPEFMRSWFDLVRGLAAAYSSRISTFKGEASLGSGITAIELPGHTPGHTGYFVESGGDRMLIWGDMAVSTAVQFPHPKTHMLFDIDGETGYKSRIKGFELAAAERLLVAGTHLTFPTFGYVAKKDGAYEWIAEEWRHDLANTPWVPVV